MAAGNAALKRSIDLRWLLAAVAAAMALVAAVGACVAWAADAGEEDAFADLSDVAMPAEDGIDADARKRLREMPFDFGQSAA